MAPTSTEPTYIGMTGIQGRNGSDAHFLIPDRQCLEAVNVDWFQSALGRKRPGSTVLGMTGGTAASLGIKGIYRHVPADDQTLAELWSVDGNRLFHRLTASTSWADVPYAIDGGTGLNIDPLVGFPEDVTFQSFNGKLYIAYLSAHNRLHCWDGTSIRPVGLSLPPVPGPLFTFAGAVTDTRKYRIAHVVKNADGVTMYRSNLSNPSVAQALVAQFCTVDRGAVESGVGITHWELYGASISTLYGDYRLLSTEVVGTTGSDDNNATLPATVAPADGANTPPPSCRYMVADDARIIMGGTFMPTVASPYDSAMAPSNHRVWWTSILSSSVGDDSERVSNTGTINNYADIEEAITGISPPLQLVTASASSLERGSFYVFSYNGQWKFVATGVATAPYIKFRITGGFGCIKHETIVIAEDVNGNPAIYWLSRRGPMRISSNGQEFIGEDILDIWKTVNLDATTVGHAIFHADLHQVWFFVATGTATHPNLKLVFDTRLGRITETSGVRGGWSQHNGVTASTFCACMFSENVGASMSRRLKPYVGVSAVSTFIAVLDNESEDDDYGNVYQAYIDSKSYAPWGLNRKGGMAAEALLIADPSPGVSIQLSIYRNEGAEITYSKADLTDLSDSGEADSVFAIFEDSRLADSYTFRCRIGDAAAVSSQWNLDALIVPLGYQGDH